MRVLHSHDSPNRPIRETTQAKSKSLIPVIQEAIRVRVKKSQIHPKSKVSRFQSPKAMVKEAHKRRKKKKSQKHQMLKH